MKSRRLKKSSFIALVALAVAVATIVITIASVWLGILFLFKYTITWEGKVDFYAYKEEFQLVRDYTETYMNGKEGRLRVSYDRNEKEYRLYDSDQELYLDCPENVQEALETICTDAFTNSEFLLDSIQCRNGAVVFYTDNGYSLIYSSERKPTQAYHTSRSGVVVFQILGGGWYHVSIWTT